MKTAIKTPSTIFTTPNGKTRMVAWHERFRSRVDRPMQSLTLEMRFGCTHAPVCGPEDAPRKEANSPAA